MQEAGETTWRFTEDNRLLLFRNNNYTLPPVEETKEGEKKKPQEDTGPIFISNRKTESKGAPIYTPLGYGLIQDFRPNNMISVKLGKDHVAEFSRNDVMFDIPIVLKVMSSAGVREDKIVVPVTSVAREIVERLEGLSTDGGQSMSVRVFWKGAELARTNETLDQLGLVPDSKLGVLITIGRCYTINRFTIVYNGWGYSSSPDGVSFTVNKDVSIAGFGIYGSEKTDSLSGTAKFLLGKDVKGSPLVVREVTVVREEGYGDGKIYRFMFDRPIRVKANESYSVAVELRSGTSYYGSGGQNTVNGEKDVIFSFTNATNSTNGTGTSSGQIPEIYYYI
eukprot:TRINITY_DN8435_c0_g1_i1.p1 TRINITY_DN8435_c0_g1~~TRINITY_DN8435_c0_g1_i1.p1  ORF type:complete len:336 (-),score=54.60 TRINITY_DN8435_c0_g1_i1:154-1161(-)